MRTKKELIAVVGQAKDEADRRRKETCPFRRGPGTGYWNAWFISIAINDVDGGYIYNGTNDRNGESVSGYTSKEKFIKDVFDKEKATAPQINCACEQ